jgi:hypothetical protein
MGGNIRGKLDRQTRTAISDAELQPQQPGPGTSGDDYLVTYDAAGYPELPRCLDQRPQART